MSNIKFFPLGNADSALITTESGKLILIDFGNKHSGDDYRGVDLAVELKAILSDLQRAEIDVVVFTHLDDDHYKGFSDFFYLEHAAKYQEGERIKISELWVPAQVVIETGAQVDDEADILRAEARYRLKNDERIKVFSRPELLGEWLEEQGLSIDERGSCIANAGELVDNFTLSEDGLEIFPHAPFAADQDAEPGFEINRNDNALILHITFAVAEGRDIKVMFGADNAANLWKDIVYITEQHNNGNRLEWDIFKLPHHCSYRSLNEDKDDWDENHEPIAEVKKLYDTYGREGSTIISTSEPIDANADSDQPPHKEAAEFYQKIAEDKGGQFIVTMEHPSEDSPEVLELEITATGAEVKHINQSKLEKLTLKYPSDKEEIFNVKYSNIPVVLDPAYKLRIDTNIQQNGFRKGTLLFFIQNRWPLLKEKSLIFEVVECNVETPYDLYWKVRNFGDEASSIGQLRGEITKDTGKKLKQETTRYRGEHYVECYCVKNGVCVAQSSIWVPII